MKIGKKLLLVSAVSVMAISSIVTSFAKESVKTIENGETAGYWALKPGSDDDWIYVKSGGSASNYNDWVKNAWIFYKNAWYYIEPDGEMYDDDDDSINIDGVDYMFQSNGILINSALPAPAANNWVRDDDDWNYYQNGVLVRNSWILDNGLWYYAEDDGDIITADDDDEIEIEKINGSCYAFRKDGSLYVNTKVYDSDERITYYADENGVLYYNNQKLLDD